MSDSNLKRNLGLSGLAATGICSMLGASVYIVPFMIQRNVEGIGPYVIPAFLLAAVPALFAAISYATLAAAMPVAGGSYIYASRGLNSYLGFIASFSQWFGLSIAIGVIAYVIIPFIRDAATTLHWFETAALLENGWVRVGLALALLWVFVSVNIRGLGIYQKTLIPLMVLMFFLGAMVIWVGFTNSHEDYAAANSLVQNLESGPAASWSVSTFLSGAAVLFASFIGFDSIAQAGSEAKNPRRNLPLAISITILSVGSFYLLFTGAVYHTVPWKYVAAQAAIQDITAPGLLSPLLSPGLAALIVIGAAVALINDLPAMLLSVSRLMYAWAEDRIFPRKVAEVHRKYNTPHIALICSGMVASLGIIGSHFAGDFFLGVDIMVTSMLVNFLLMCLTLGMIHTINPPLASRITLIKSQKTRLVISFTGITFLLLFLFIHISKDLSSSSAWYFKSTLVWILVMVGGSILYLVALNKLKKEGVSVDRQFSELPFPYADQAESHEQ